MKFFIKTFGCRLNQSETQSIIEAFESEGLAFTSNFKEADICILNTCTVTHKADKDAVKLLRIISENNPKAELAVTGCSAEMHSDEIKEMYPTVLVIGNENKKNILKMMGISNKELSFTVKGHKGHSRAFVKIQDGCSENCSYCIVSKARPIKTSKPCEAVLKEIKGLIKNGYKEIVLSGINIGNYNCPDTKIDLADLSEKIFEIKGNFRLRLSSIELNTITEKLVYALVKGKEKFCDYFHIPLQSGSDKVLSDMNRHYTTAEYFEKIKFLRGKFSDNVGIFADVIVGYPTETKADFAKTREFIKKVNFRGLHTFSYSKRPYTDAFKLRPLPVETVKQRAKKLRISDKELRTNFAKKQIGSEHKVLLEKVQPYPVGLTSNFQKVKITALPESSTPLKPGNFYIVKISSSENDLCLGEIIT